PASGLVLRRPRPGWRGCRHHDPRVDQTQGLFEDRDEKGTLRLESARQWATPVPREAFRRITGEADFPAALTPRVRDGVLDCACNAELRYRIGDVFARADVSWILATPPGGGDTSETLARGTRADVTMERTARTGYRRTLLVRPHGVSRQTLLDLVAALRPEFPGVEVVPADAERDE